MSQDYALGVEHGESIGWAAAEAKYLPLLAEHEAKEAQADALLGDVLRYFQNYGTCHIHPSDATGAPCRCGFNDLLSRLRTRAPSPLLAEARSRLKVVRDQCFGAAYESGDYAIVDEVDAIIAKLKEAGT